MEVGAALPCTSGERSQVVDEAPLLLLDAASIRIVAGRDTIALLADLAEPPAQQTRGLKERRPRADTAGMPFIAG
jgi:hypothetical protein